MSTAWQDADQTMYQRMCRGESYDAQDPYIQGMQGRAQTIQHMANHAETVALAQPYLAQLFGTVGANTEIRPPVYVDYGAHTSIGANVFINYGLVALDVAAITIGDDCQIATNVQLLTATHPVNPVQRLKNIEHGEPITLGRNVWLGGGVIVLPGVSIGDNSVVGAGSVVTKDVPANVVVAGNPARWIRDIEDPAGEPA